MCTIGIDIDGVLTNQAEQVIKYARQMFDIKIDINAMTDYDFSKCTPLTKRQLYEIFVDHFFNSSMNALDYAQTATKILRKMLGFKIYFISNRSTYLQNVTITWLRNNFISFAEVDVHLIGNKSKIFWLDKKWEIFDYFVEDCYETACVLAEEGYCGTVFLMKWPWTENKSLPKNVILVDGWEEIIDRIIEMEEQK